MIRKLKDLIDKNALLPEFLSKLRKDSPKITVPVTSADDSRAKEDILIPSDNTFKIALFAAGLGDAIRVIYRTKNYQYICEATKPVHVIVATHNPFTMEIFRYHRNVKNFILYELGHKFDEFIREGLRGPDVNNALFGFIGGGRTNAILEDRDESFVPFFDAPDDVDSKGHIIFQPFAGNHDDRSFKPEFIEKMLSVLRKQKKTVYILTRSYIRKGVSGKVVHSEENAKQYEGGNIVVLDNLSVPACLNLVKNSSGYVGAWSSMQQAAWFENKPVAVFYPVNYVDVVNRTGYAFGLDRESCHHSDYPSLDMAKFESWVNELK